MNMLLAVFALLVGAEIVSGAAATPSSNDPPLNVLFMLGDDWGWGDVGAYGADGDYRVTGTMVKTPRLDQLAKEGTLFTDFHVAQSFCAPTRTSFMTGRFPADLRVNTNWRNGPNDWKWNKEVGLPYQLDPNITNIANVMQAGGYRTAHFGKWHLGGFNPPDTTPSPLPHEYGFDLTGTYGSVIEGNTSLSNPKDLCAGNYSSPWWNADVGDFIVNETIKFMKESLAENKPFYINAWWHMSHNTIDPRPEWLEPYPFKQTCLFAATALGETVCPAQIYWSAQRYSDMRFGMLIDAIDALGIRNNTMIVFSTDNGAQARTWTDGNGGVMDTAIGVQGPFRGSKGSLYEGGHRVPFIVSLPGRVPQGRVDHSLISSVDWLPTVADLTGVSIPASTLPDLRGHSIVSILEGKSNNVIDRGDKPLFWRGGGGPPPCWNISPSLCTRKGDWKLLINPLMDRVELYNVSVFNLQDGSFEMQNLADQNQDVVNEMSEAVLAWHHSLFPVRPNETDHGMSVKGCTHYKFPGL